MNFLAHAEVARRSGGDDPRFVLGAVLPDLLPMAGVRLDRSDVPAAVAAGWREHHRADAAFHASPAFLTGVHALRLDLRATTLGTGPRRAAAHVGWELLLDDAVAGDEALLALFRAALAEGRSLTDDPRWHALLDRFEAMPRVLDGSGRHPTRTVQSSVVGQRVQRACARRPRLAFGDEHLPALAAVLGAHHERVVALAPALLAEVAAGSQSS